MKKFTLFLMTMMVSVISLFAQEPAAPKFSALATDGETVQYLYNVETHAFVLGANDWNTRASVSVEKGYKFKIADNGNGTYTLNDYVETQNAWKAVFAGNATDIWVDNLGGANVKGWVITSVGENLYKITNPGASATGELSVIQDLSDTRLNLNVSNPEAYGATWALVSEDDYAEYIASYDVEAVKEYVASKKESVTAALQGVIDEANRASIEARENLANATNIYGEGYDEWVAKTAEFKGLVEAGNYTEKIVNPNAITGWHSSTEFNFLLTPWTVGGEQANKFDKALYINTWSTEGVSDGSNFLVPFFEYWTGDDNSLGANVLEAKVEGLVAGKAYDVEAWTRVRVKNGQNGAAPYGITLQAGDGEAVNACGEQVGTSQMYLTKVAVKGNADENGVLSIKYNIDADNNISWLSYKDVKYTEAAPELAKIEDGDYFIINVATGRYLNGANSWGTKASVTKTAQAMTIAMLEDGTYTIDSHISNGGNNHFVGAGDNVFVDGAASPQTIEKVADGIVAIKDVNGKYLTVETGLVVNFKGEDATDDAAQWKFVTKEELYAGLAEAKEDAPIDASFLIADANLSRNNLDYSAWKGDAPAKNAKAKDSLASNMNLEMWGGSSQTFDTYQEIELPNGIYSLSVQGFYRYNNTTENTNDVAKAAHADGTEVIYSKLYANNDTVALKSIWDDEIAFAAEYDTNIKIPFSQNEAADAFSNGFYSTELKVEVTDGKLKFGIVKTDHIGCDWTVWDNFELFYYGEKVVPEPEPEPELAESDLTKEMFFQYYSNTTGEALETPATIGSDYNVGTSTGMVYGLSTVKWFAYADLTNYEKLVLNVTEGTPRVMYNREMTPDNADADGVNHVEITGESPYLTIEENEDGSKSFIYDLKAMAAADANKPYVHINAIKGANWANTTVTSMKLYAVADAPVPSITSVDITFDAEEGAEIDLAETKSIHIAIACPEGIEKDAELLINGAIIDKDGNSTPVTAFTDFEDCTDAAISQLTPGETYTLVINKVAFGEVIGVEDDKFTPIYKNTIVAEEGSSLASLTFSIKAEAEPEIAGTKFNIAPGGNCELPIPADAVRVFNFSGQWASCAPTTNSFDAAIYKNITVEFEEALEFYFNTPYVDATGAQQWGGAAVGTTTFVLDLATVGSITDFSIQNVSTDPTNFAIKNAYATKLDDTVEPLIFTPGGWGVAMNVDGVTDGVATFKGQWAGLNVDNSILNKEGKKTLRVYANQPIPTTAQWCVKYADDNSDGWPALGISETDPTYAECVIDRPVSSIFLQWTVAEVGSIDIKAITWEIDETTAIESIETADNTSVKKMMVNGKLVIVKGGKTYNVAGALVK